LSRHPRCSLRQTEGQESQPRSVGRRQGQPPRQVGLEPPAKRSFTHLDRGRWHLNAIQAECYPEEFKKAAEKHGKKLADVLKAVPSFTDGYQAWYSEASTIVKQLLPDRLADFIRLYEKPKSRKDLTHENYTIEDFLQGLTVTRNIGEQQDKIVGPESAIPRFRQQLAILESVNARFERSLFDIRILVQAEPEI
jgi:hypothetical protein